MTAADWRALGNQYLDQREVLGYARSGVVRPLDSLVAFLVTEAPDGLLTVDRALAWAVQAPSGSPIVQNRRLGVARGFAQFLAVSQPGTEIPPARLLGPSHRRLPPTIFSPAEIRDLMAATSSLASFDGLRPLSMRALVGLLAATGLRPGEAVRLLETDVDLAQGLLYVRPSKSGRARWVPLHPSAQSALQCYWERRQAWSGAASEDAFFLRDGGKPLGMRQADYAFRQLCRTVGWTAGPDGRWPRLYDLRHTFVCQRLLAWYEAGEPVAAKIPYLAAYLGHSKISSTYWYLTATPALMAATSHRFEGMTASLGEPT